MRPAINFFLLFFFSVCQLEASYSYFLPPSDWELADPSTLSPHVLVGFIGKNTSGFRPSLNLAEEEVDISMDEYLQVVKKIHEKHPHTRWRDLGRFTCKAGVGRLTEIDTRTEWGEARLLQMMVLHENKVHILTAAASKEEFPQLYIAFRDAMRSLAVTDDFLSCIAENKRSELEEKTLELFLRSQDKDEEFEKRIWLPFQQTVINDHKDMGACWQLFFLRQIQELL